MPAIGDEQRTLRISTRNRKLLKGLELGAKVTVTATGKIQSISLPEEYEDFEDPDEIREFPGHIEVELDGTPEVNERDNSLQETNAMLGSEE